MPKREKPADAAVARPPRKTPSKRTQPEGPREEAGVPKPRADDIGAVVFKEENSDGITAKELLRRLAVRAAVSPSFIEALRRDFTRHGASAIAKTRELAPATYVRLAAVLLPMDAEPAAPVSEPEALPEPVAPEEAEAVALRIAELRAFIARERAGEGEGAAAVNEAERGP